nr:reverse transcriptase, RNA-dependent DNA polymerase [Tanacetum cinerariifolium]
MVIQDLNSSVNNANLNPNNASNSINDPLYTGNSDHHGMVLTNTPFNGSSFLGWSRTIKMALGAKLKLGFINGTYVNPISEGKNLQRWIRCNYMVTCWILNSMDELHNLNGVHVCSCGKMQGCSCNMVDKFLEIEERSKLVQFLMKLNGDYESIGHHVCYKGKKNKKGGKLAANVVFGLKTPFDMGYENELQGEKSNHGLNHKFVMKMFNEKNHVTNSGVALHLAWKTPFEILLGKPPSYETLKTIGCLCYAASLGPQRDKFDPKGIRCVLIGYPPGQKGYKLYSLKTYEVLHSRDVIFQENVFL